MPLLNTDITTLDATTLRSIEDFLVTYLSTEQPELDLSPGSVLFQLVIRPGAIFHALNLQNMDNNQDSNSLLKVIEDPTTADADALDNLLSNYFIARLAGTPATGGVRIILNESRLTPVSLSTVFTVDGVEFRPIRAIAGVRTAADVVSGGEELIQPLGDKFYFNVPVQASAVGAAGNVPADTRFTSTLTASNVDSIVAASDFTGGANTESNEQLIARASTGISNKSMSGRENITALLTDTYAAIQDVSIIGAGDREMQRDKRNALGIQNFGKVDIYLKTSTSKVSKAVRKNATLLDANTQTWAVTFDTDESSGVYEVEQVQDAEQTESYELVSLLRAPSIPAGLQDFIPSMAANDAAFTRYQSLTLTFKAPPLDQVNGSTREFTFVMPYQPFIDEISDYATSRAVRPVGADTLVRAAIPCFVTLGIQLVEGAGETITNVADIKRDIVEAFNGLDFSTGILSVDAVIDTIKELLPKRSRVKMPIDMRGRIILPHNEVTYNSANDGNVWLFNSDAISVPESYEDMLSTRTCSFFISESDINITVLPSDRLVV